MLVLRPRCVPAAVLESGPAIRSTGLPCTASRLQVEQGRLEDSPKHAALQRILRGAAALTQVGWWGRSAPAGRIQQGRQDSARLLPARQALLLVHPECVPPGPGRTPAGRQGVRGGPAPLLLHALPGGGVRWAGCVPAGQRRQPGPRRRQCRQRRGRGGSGGPGVRQPRRRLRAGACRAGGGGWLPPGSLPGSGGLCLGAYHPGSAAPAPGLSSLPVALAGGAGAGAAWRGRVGPCCWNSGGCCSWAAGERRRASCGAAHRPPGGGGHPSACDSSHRGCWRRPGLAAHHFQRPLPPHPVSKL